MNIPAAAATKRASQRHTRRDERCHDIVGSRRHLGDSGVLS